MESGSNSRTISDSGQVLASPESTAQLGTKFADLHSRHEAWMEAMHLLSHQPLTLDSSGVHTVQFGETLRTIAERLIHMRGERATRTHIDQECDRLIQLNKQDYPSLESNPDYLSSGLEYGREAAWQLRTVGTPEPVREEQPVAPQPLSDNGSLAAPLLTGPSAYDEDYLRHHRRWHRDDYYRHRHYGDSYPPDSLFPNSDVGTGFLGARSVDASQVVGGILASGIFGGGFGDRHHWYGHRWYRGYAYGGTGGDWPTDNIDNGWNNDLRGSFYPDNYVGDSYGPLSSAYSLPIAVGHRGGHGYGQHRVSILLGIKSPITRTIIFENPVGVSHPISDGNRYGIAGPRSINNGATN